MEFAEQKRGLINALTNTLRTSRLVDMLNAQEAVAAFAMVMDPQEHVEPNAAGLKPIDIARFYEWLTVEKGLPKDIVAETLLFLKSREARYQVDLVLPQEVLAIDEATRAKIIQEFVQRGASTSGIYQGANVANPTASGGSRPAPGASGANPKSAPGGSSGAQPKSPAVAVPPPRKGSASKRPTGLLVAFALVAAGGVGLTVYMNNTAPKRAAPITLNDYAALPCREVTAVDGYIMCRITTEQFNAMSPAQFNKAGNATRAAGARQGHALGVTVVTQEDNVVRGAF